MSRDSRLLASLSCLFLIVLHSTALTADGPSGKEVPYGLEKRIPLTTSRVVGYPEPPLPFRSVSAFPKLKFKAPLYLINLPGSDRLLVVEQKGKILSFKNDAATDSTDVFLELKDRDAYSIIFHPKFLENRIAYVFSNGPNAETKKKNRISRFTVTAEMPRRCDPQSEFVIIEWVSNGHNGGDMAFGPDGYLYISSGDGTSDSDGDLTGQDIRDLTSGMLRLDVERPDPGKGYAVPKDNPFLSIPDARPELWAYGFRNPWRIYFDLPNNRLWVGDIGQDLWEMIHIVKRGANYGWSVNEGSHPFYLERKRGPTPISPPTIEHPHSEARSITGGVVYYGSKFKDLIGAYVYGDYGTGKIWACRCEGDKITWHREIADTPYQILSFGSDQAGEIYFVDYAGGLVYGLEPIPPEKDPPQFPTRLSQTGLFQSVAGHKTEPALIPYSVNSPLWSDNAYKERFIALPEMTQVDYNEKSAWKFPERTVLVKTFSLEEQEGNAATRRRIETRLLLLQQGEWTGYSYLWNDEQTDATLVEPAGTDRTFTIRPASGAGPSRSQAWHYPSRAECMVCHSRAASYVLGLTTAQMNKNHDYGGVIANQIRTLDHLGIFKAKVTDPVKAAKLPDPHDATIDLEQRVRSYLQSNCAQCHVAAGGGNAAMELGFSTPLEKTMIVGVRPQHDTFGIQDAKLVAPGDPDHSILLQRLTRTGRGRMPPLATSIVDEKAAGLFREWIAQLKEKKAIEAETPKKN